MLCREGLGACQEKWSKSIALSGKFLPESGLEMARERGELSFRIVEELAEGGGGLEWDFDPL